MPKKAFTIGKRVALLSGFLLSVIFSLGIVSYWNTNGLSREIAILGKTAVPAVRDMTLVDMMHDGIRAVVLNSIIVSGSKDKQKIDEVRTEREEMSANIRKYLADLNALPEINENTKKLILDAGPGIEAYVQSAKEVSELALDGKVQVALSKLDQFGESFESLEKSLGALGETVEKDSEALYR